MSLSFLSRCPSSAKRIAAFTLVELLASIGVLALLLAMFMMSLSTAQRVLIQGRKKIQVQQDARIALELIAKDLGAAVVSERYQFVQSPNLSSLIPELAPNSPSLFWIMHGRDDDKGSLSEVGYFLTRDATTSTYQLCRFYVPPSNTDGFYLAGSDDYLPHETDTPWLTTLPDSAFDPNAPSGVTTPIADGVVGLWIQCFDRAGNSIPWVYLQNGYKSSPTLQFNSNASFQMANADSPFENGATFQYSNPNRTLPANELPESVVITLVFVDSHSLLKNPYVPTMPAPTSDTDISADIHGFIEDLHNAGIASAQVYSTRITFNQGCNP